MKKLSVPVRAGVLRYPAGLVLLFISIFLFVSFPVSAEIWEDFTVWYDGNGADSGHIAQVNYPSGTKNVTLKDNAASAGTSDVPYAKNGCSFIGWCLLDQGGSAIAPILPGGAVWDPVDVPVTWIDSKNGFVFYARWDCDNYTVTYDGNGADSGSIRVQTGTKNSRVTVKGNGGTPGDVALSRNGYVFSGWNSAPDGSGLAYAAGSQLTLASDFHLYAVWTLMPTATATMTNVPTATATNTSVPTATATSTATTVPTATKIPATATSVPTATKIPATATSVPTATKIPATATTVPTATRIPPTSTTAPTATQIPATATTVPTATKIPATATSVPTATQIPAAATSVPTATQIPAAATTAPTATNVPLMINPENIQPTAPLLMIAPQTDQNASAAITPTAVSVVENPALMIAPPVQSVQVAEPAETDTEIVSVPNSSYSDSALFNMQYMSDTGNLVELPKTGITSVSGFHRSMMPADISYIPLSMELQIPGLNVISDIVSVESTEAGYPIEYLEMDTGFLADTARPGEGFSVLAAHNTINADTYGPFALISLLESGDRFFIRTEDGGLMIFEVYSNAKIGEFDYESLYKSGLMYDNTVTLLTCEDERPDGGYASRRIVSARRIH